MQSWGLVPLAALSWTVSCFAAQSWSVLSVQRTQAISQPVCRWACVALEMPDVVGVVWPEFLVAAQNGHMYSRTAMCEGNEFSLVPLYSRLLLNTIAVAPSDLCGEGRLLSSRPCQDPTKRTSSAFE